MTSPELAHVEYSAEGLATMVALTTAWRRGDEGVSVYGFRDLVSRTVADIGAKPDSHERLCWLVYQLAAGQGDLCEQWNKSVDGTPADEWLAELAQAAALDLVDVSGV